MVPLAASGVVVSARVPALEPWEHATGTAALVPTRENSGACVARAAWPRATRIACGERADPRDRQTSCGADTLSSMSDTAGTDRIPLQLIQGCLVASIQVDLTDDVLTRFRRELLDRIDSTRVHGVVLDVSGVEVMDAVDFELLRTTMAMASVMGATPVIVGLKPGIVSALMDLDVDIRDIRAALNLDDALKLLRQPDEAVTDSAPDSDPEADADERAQ